MKKLTLLLFLALISFTPSYLFSEPSYPTNYAVIEKETNRLLYGSNENVRRLTASIAKIMTLTVALTYGNLSDIVTVGDEINQAVGSKIYIEVGMKIPLKDLLYGLMLESGNDASLTIAKHIGGSLEGFVYLMNEMAKQIGMKNSTFENPSGLDEDTENYSTPYDMAILTSYASKLDHFYEIAGAKSYVSKSEKTLYFNHKHRLIKTNKMFIAGKTGYTKRAGRTLVSVAKKDNMEVIIVTFNDPSDWNHHTYLADLAFSQYNNKLVLKKQVIASNAYLNQNVYIPIRENELSEVSSEVFLYEKPINGITGYLIIYLKGYEIARYNLKSIKDKETNGLISFVEKYL